MKNEKVKYEKESKKSKVKIQKSTKSLHPSFSVGCFLSPRRRERQRFRRDCFTLRKLYLLLFSAVGPYFQGTTTVQECDARMLIDGKCS